MKKAVVLFSGGLDSTTCLAMAKAQGYDCYALSFAYGQRHQAELDVAARIAAQMGVLHKVVKLDLAQFGGSSLTDQGLNIPSGHLADEIPNTYVPARNTVFLAIALSYAESLGAEDIFIGVSAIDYSNYPDCRPEFIKAFEILANCGTKAVDGHAHYTIQTPLITLTKAQTIQIGLSLGIDYSQTVSCYQLTDAFEACGYCPSCLLRRRGFLEAGVDDMTTYLLSI